MSAKIQAKWVWSYLALTGDLDECGHWLGRKQPQECPFVRQSHFQLSPVSTDVSLNLPLMVWVKPLSWYHRNHLVSKILSAGHCIVARVG